ncbi:hypothetical protein H8R23_05090 [Flavobacterium sp. F-380]|uniref:Uncharacterized protein n=1 Tax=Flavobacterium kayseriense TaxID=2764714 RepID=A0ABR7J5T1_9FLAO|nr:hypothetical protein [Flavobacterium kayseriense]MBC5840773.1 hypothetical protein [Flavobacterium kayseriense]MBC5846557.1 hypothetical protein [Flavobacterium kayseriense]
MVITMEDEPIKPELLALGVEIQMELISIGMDEVEIMNFWDECYKAAQKNKPETIKFKNHEQN